MKDSDVQRTIKTLEENLMKAAGLHSDKGYSLGTKEDYEAFAKQRNKSIAEGQNMNKEKPTLFLIRGLPGSGKSTLANLMNQYAMTMINLEADDFFTKYNPLTNAFDYNFDPTKLKDAHQWCQDTALHFLQEGFNVSVSNTSVTNWEVGTYADIAMLAGANFVSMIVENYHGNKNIHGCPDEKVQQMKRKFYIQL